MRILRIFVNSFKSQFWILSRPVVYVILILFFATELVALRVLGFYPGPDYFSGAFLPPPISQFKSLAIMAVTNINGFASSRYWAAVTIALMFSVLFNSLLAAIFQVYYLPRNSEATRRDRISVRWQFIKQVVVNFLYILVAFVVGGSVYFGVVALSGALAIAGPVPAFAGAVFSAILLPIILILLYMPLAAALAFKCMRVNELLKILKRSWPRLLIFSSIFVAAIIVSKTLLVNIICSPINLVSTIWLKWAMFFAATFLLLLLSAIQNFFGLLFSRGIIQASFEKNSIDIS